MNYIKTSNINKYIIIIIYLFISCSPKKNHNIQENKIVDNKIVVAKNFEEITIDFTKSFEIIKEVDNINMMELSMLVAGVFKEDYMVLYDKYLNLIMKFDYDGNLLEQKEFSTGKGPGEIDGFVHSIRKFRNDGYIITCFSRIIILDKDFDHISTYSINFKTKDAFDIGEGRIVICGYNSQNHKLFHIYDYEGKYKSSFGKPFIEKNKQVEMYLIFCQPYYYYDNYIFASSIFNYKIGIYNLTGELNYIFDGNMNIENKFLNGAISIPILSIFAYNNNLYISIINYYEGSLYLDIWNLKRMKLGKRILFKNDKGYLVYINKDKYIFLTGSGFFITKSTKSINI